MSITEERLLQIIKDLKRNGYKVFRNGDPVDGFATGTMTIRHKDRNGFGIKTEVDLSLNIDHDKELTEMFGL